MINVDRVYQKVLAIANKEQRGYITPQEFNLFAAQAQMEIFEQYFYDINQWSRQSGNSHAYSDMLEILEQKINHFKVYNADASHVAGVVAYNNEEIYRLGEVRVEYQSQNSRVEVVAEKIKAEEYNLYSTSPLARENFKRPIYWQITDPASSGSVRIALFPRPFPEDNIHLSYVRKPKDPNWTYMVSAPPNQTALYNPSANDHQNFELEPSEESELVNKILTYAGVALQKQDVVQIAAGREAVKVQQEKS